MTVSVRPDVARWRRTGFPEVVLAEGKSIEEIERALRRLLRADGLAIVSRLDPDRRERLELPDEVEVEYDGRARLLIARAPGYDPPYRGGRVAALAAGTSDLPYLREATLILEAMGVKTREWVDVGLAGPHRFFTALRELREFRPHAVIVAAGMDGHLPIAVNALVDVPVIGLPTPSGYGAGGSGKAALLSMLQTCSPGLTVVNIGNGVGAAAAAAKIVRTVLREGGND